MQNLSGTANDSKRPNNPEKEQILRPQHFLISKHITNQNSMVCARVQSHFSCVQLCANLWTVARQVPLSMGFYWWEYWSKFPFPSPGGLPDPEIKPLSSVLQPVSLPLSHQGSPTLVRDQLFGTLWTIAWQAPLSMGFSRQEYWSGLPCSPSGDLPDPGIKPESPASKVKRGSKEQEGLPRWS